MNKMEPRHPLSFVPWYAPKDAMHIFDIVQDQLDLKRFSWWNELRQFIRHIEQTTPHSVLLRDVHDRVEQTFHELGGRAIKITPGRYVSKMIDPRQNAKVSFVNLFDIDLLYDVLCPFLYQHAEKIVWGEKNQAAQMLMLTEKWSQNQQNGYFVPVRQEKLRDFLAAQWKQLLDVKHRELMQNNVDQEIQQAYMQYADDGVTDVSARQDGFLEPAYKFRLLGRLTLCFWFIPLSILKDQVAYRDMSEYEQGAQLLTLFFHELPASLSDESAYFIPDVPKKKLSRRDFEKYVARIVHSHDINSDEKAQQLFPPHSDFKRIRDIYTELRNKARQSTADFFAKYLVPARVMKERIDNESMDVPSVSMHDIVFVPLYTQILDRMFPKSDDASYKTRMIKMIERVVSDGKKSGHALDWLHQYITPLIYQIDSESPPRLPTIQSTMKTAGDKLAGYSIKLVPTLTGLDVRVRSQDDQASELFDLDFFYDMLCPFLYTYLPRFFTRLDDAMFINYQCLDNVMRYRAGTDDITPPVSREQIYDWIKHRWVEIYEAQRTELLQYHHLSQEDIQDAYERYVENREEIRFPEDIRRAILSVRHLGKSMMGCWFVPGDAPVLSETYSRVAETARALVAFYHALPSSISDLPHADRFSNQDYETHINTMLDVQHKNTDMRKRFDDLVERYACRSSSASPLCFWWKELRQLVFDVYPKPTEDVAQRLEEIKTMYKTIHNLINDDEERQKDSPLIDVLSELSRVTIPVMYSRTEAKEESPPQAHKSPLLISFHDTLFVPVYHRILAHVFPDETNTSISMLRFLETYMPTEPQHLADVKDILVKYIISPMEDTSTPLRLDDVQHWMQHIFTQQLDGHTLCVSLHDFKIKIQKTKDRSAWSSLFDIDLFYDILFPFLFENLSRMLWKDEYERRQYISMVEKWTTHRDKTPTFHAPVLREDLRQYMEKAWSDVYHRYERERLDENMVTRLHDAYEQYAMKGDIQKRSSTLSSQDVQTAQILRSIGKLMFGVWFVPLPVLRSQPIYDSSPKEAHGLARFLLTFPASLDDTSKLHIPEFPRKTWMPGDIVRFLKETNDAKGDIGRLWNELYLMTFKFLERSTEQRDAPGSTLRQIQDILDDIHTETTKPDNSTPSSFRNVQAKFQMLDDISKNASNQDIRAVLDNVLLFLSRSLFPYVYVLKPEGEVPFPGRGSSANNTMMNDSAFEHRILEIKNMATKLMRVKESFYAMYHRVLQKQDLDTSHQRANEESKQQRVTNVEDDIKQRIKERDRAIEQKREAKAELEAIILKNARYVRGDENMRGFGLFDQDDDTVGVMERRLREYKQRVRSLEDEIHKIHETKQQLQHRLNDIQKTKISKETGHRKDGLIDSIRTDLEQNERQVQENYNKAKEVYKDFQENKNAILFKKLEFLYRESRALLDESEEMVSMWKRRENIDVDTNQNQTENRELVKKWEDELDRKERLLIKREKQVQEKKQCFSWREKVGQALSPSFNIDVFELLNTKMDNFEQRLEPFEKNTNTDLARFVNDAFQYVDGGSSSTEDGRFNVLVEKSFKKAYKKAIGFGYRAIRRYRRFHFDFIMKRIRRELDYIRFWRRTPGYKESVANYEKHFEKVDRRLKALSERAQTFLLTQFEKTFTKNMERFDLANIIDNVERMDYLIYQRQVLAKARQLAKYIQNDYFGKTSLVQMFIDRQFLMSIALNVLSFGMFLGAMYLGEKMFKDIYQRKNYANNPSLYTYVGATLAYYLGMQIIVIGVLLGVYSLNFYTYYIDTKFIYNYVIEQGFQFLVLAAVSAVLTGICENVSYFRYDQEAFRAFRALKAMLVPISIVLFIVPLFYLL